MRPFHGLGILGECNSRGKNTKRDCQCFTHWTGHDLGHRFPLMIYIFQGRYAPDLCDLSHVAGRKPCNLHVLARVSWVGFGTQILENIS